MTNWKVKTKAKVEKLGGRIEDDSVGYDRGYQIIAPDGYYWTGAGLHCCVVAYFQGPWKDLINEQWKDAFERIDGIEACNDPDCDMCYPEE